MSRHRTYATYGGEFGGGYGGETGLRFGRRLPAGYSLKLRDRLGNERLIGPSQITSASIDLNHTQLSGFDISLPADRSFAEWRRADADLYYGDDLLFRGVLLKTPTPLFGDGETTLTGACRGHYLTRGHNQIEFDPDREAWSAIQFVWNELTRFEATVHAPPEDSRVAVPDSSVEGSPMSILKELHEHAGMRFTINHRSTEPRAESYYRTTIEKPATWTVLDGKTEPDSTEYANQVIVRGAKKTPEGTARHTGTATRESRVEEDGLISISIDDRGLTSDRACQDRALTELPGYVTGEQTTGTLSIVPQYVAPGHVYRVDSFDAGSETAPLHELESVTLGESYGSDGGEVECELDFSGERPLVRNLKRQHRRQRRVESRL